MSTANIARPVPAPPKSAVKVEPIVKKVHVGMQTRIGDRIDPQLALVLRAIAQKGALS